MFMREAKVSSTQRNHSDGGLRAVDKAMYSKCAMYKLTTIGERDRRTHRCSMDLLVRFSPVHKVGGRQTVLQ